MGNKFIDSIKHIIIEDDDPKSEAKQEYIRLSLQLNQRWPMPLFLPMRSMHRP